MLIDIRVPVKGLKMLHGCGADGFSRAAVQTRDHVRINGTLDHVLTTCA